MRDKEIRDFPEIHYAFATRWVGTCRCHFRAFQLELDTLGTKNFEIATVVKKLQMFEVGRISKIREIPISPF